MPHPSPDPDIESLLASYFLPAPETSSEYELTLMAVAEQMVEGPATLQRVADEMEMEL